MVKQVQTPQAQKKSMGQGMGQGAAQGQAATNRPGDSERNEIYGVVSVIYHALQGAEAYQKYIDDAQNAGDEELQQFFDTCRMEELERAKRAKAILLERLEDEEEMEDESDDAEGEDGAGEKDEEEEEE